MQIHVMYKQSNESTVVPARAGIYTAHPIAADSALASIDWIPAFAEMTI